MLASNSYAINQLRMPSVVQSSMLRWLIVLLVLVVAGGASTSSPDAARRPSITIEQARTASSARPGTLEVTVEAPGGALHDADDRARAERQDDPALLARRSRSRRPLTQLDADQSAHHAPVRQAERPRAAAGHRAHRRHGDAAVVPRACARCRARRRATSRSASSRRASPSSRPITTSTTAASEMVVYRATPPDVAVGRARRRRRVPRLPASGAGVAGADPALKVAFFALLHDQDLNTPIAAFARDEAGNEAHGDVRRQRRSRSRSRRAASSSTTSSSTASCPEILEHSPELKDRAAERRPARRRSCKINGELRRMNADEIAALAKQTSPTRLWERPVRPARQLAGRGERSPTTGRTSTRARKSTSRCTSASTSRSRRTCRSSPPTPARCCNAELARHLRQLRHHRPRHGRAVALRPPVVDRREGRRHGDQGPDDRPQRHDRAWPAAITCTSRCSSAGDPVNPVEWWDPHWMQDRVERKLQRSRRRRPRGGTER